MDEITIKALQKFVTKFRDDRDWRRFHHPKDLSMSIAIEAAELMELFQWHKQSMGDRKEMEKEFKKYIQDQQLIQRIQEELADVLIYCLFLTDVLNIDLNEAIKMKIKMNEKKYPIQEVKKRDKKRE